MKNLFNYPGKFFIVSLVIIFAASIIKPVLAANVGIIETPLAPLTGVQNLYYGNLPNGSASSTALLLLQKGLTDRFRVDQMGNLTLTGKITASIVGPWTTNGNNIYSNNSGNVGIGTNNPDNLINVFQLIDFNNTDYNTKLGYQAGANVIAGAQNNTFVGYRAGYSGVSGSTNAAFNSALGELALYNNTSGNQNTALGAFAGYSNTTGVNNTALGHSALYNNAAGFQNVAVGMNAGRVQADGSTPLTGAQNSIYIGYNARGLNNSDSNSIVIGEDANGIGANTAVLGNDSITKTALKGSVGIGTTNPVNGQLEISSANNGIYSVSSGATKAGVYGLNGSYIGVEGSGGLYGVFGTSGGTAGVLANGGTYGVYGTGSSYGVYGSGSTGISGSGTAYGGNFTGGQYGVYGSGTYYSVYGTNSSNLGYGVYGVNTGGGVGVYGSGATYAGVWGSGYIGTYGDSSVVSGYGVYGHSSGNSGIAVRGDNTGTDNSSYGVYGDSINGIAIYGYSNNGYGGYFQGKGYLSAASWAYGSDRRLKENIKYFDDNQVNAMDYIQQLRPANFDYINGEKGDSGFIAQDVQAVLPNLVTQQPDGMLGLKTDELIPYLVKGMQEQESKIKELEDKIKTLEAKNN